MQHLAIYLVLFTDNFLSNLVVSLNKELIIHSLSIFNDYNNVLILIIGTIASLLAISINYFIGRMLLRIFMHAPSRQTYNNYQLLSQFSTKYNIFLLCFIILPFGSKFIPLIAGFVKVSFYRILSISAIAKLCYYIYILLL